MKSETFSPSAFHQPDFDSAESAIERIRSGNAPFAIVKRYEDHDAMILEGEMHTFEALVDIPRRDGEQSQDGCSFDTFSAIPYAQIKEKGVDVKDETPISCLIIKKQTHIAVEKLLSLLPVIPLKLEGPLTYLTDNATFASRVESVQETSIGQGAGSSFTISRKAIADITDFNRDVLLSMFRSLNMSEFGTYMNFLFHDGERSLLGASPECHISIRDGNVIMHPISGTMGKIPEVTRERLLSFLRDPKETMELFMVLDEELKQMAQMCESGGKILGPFLKEMSKVFHTMYELVGRSDKDPVDLFRASMFAPTVTGSPESSAHTVIARYEDAVRRYYSGAMMLMGRDATGKPIVDSSITIRTAEIEAHGRMTLQSGATITSGSVPTEEAQETEKKLAGFLNAVFGILGVKPQPILHLLFDQGILAALHERNKTLSEYHFNDQEGADRTVDTLLGKNITVIDNGDNFCHMLKHMMARMGSNVQVIPFHAYDSSSDDADIVVIGPGPGDPMDAQDAKMQKVEEITRSLLIKGKPFLSVCLGHQVLCKELGMQLERKEKPMQGIQKTIDLFGSKESVGFYNTYVGKARSLDGVECSIEEESKDVYALRSKHFASFQFHPESILSQNGFSILSHTLQDLIMS